MTKSTGVGRGGKRPGSGPKPKPKAPPVRPTVRLALADETGSEMARRHAEMAIKTLVSVAGEGASEAARVAAAKVLLEIAFGKPAPAAAVVGKKEQRNVDAMTAEAGTSWDKLLN